MPPMTAEEEKNFLIVLAIVFGPFILTAIAIVVARTLFPIFLIFGTLFIFATIGLLITAMIKENDSYYGNNDWWMFTGISFLICLFLWSGVGITYKIGYEIPNTSFGQSSLEVYDSVLVVIGIPSFITSTLDDATMEVVNEICENHDRDACRYAKISVETYQNARDLKDMLDTGKNIRDIAKEASS